ncbi:MAG: DUF4365 domain-containing protein [Candidatus Dormibacteraeota bacterium]|nr:DUF4365 domain-containing protein [Candidatus Dormibacteraeota bacterium]
MAAVTKASRLHSFGRPIWRVASNGPEWEPDKAQMLRPASAKTASIGVTQTQLAIEKNLGWLFREQPTEDYGIDAQVEVEEGGVVAGRLLALQIKSGLSWFKEPDAGGWWFRPNEAHVQYWRNHSLPVVVVLFNPESERCHWQLVNPHTLVRTSSDGWKVLVPEDHVLDDTARDALRQAAEGDPYILRVRELELARPWMKLLAEDKRLVIDIEEWINKTSGRGSITLGIDNEDGNNPTPLATWGVFLGLASYAETVPKLFPWADVSLHEETYDEADREQYEAECVFYDEGDRIVTQNYDEWANGRRVTDLRPYANEAGEVDRWRLELTLNQLGKAFLIVDEFATGGE